MANDSEQEYIENAAAHYLFLVVSPVLIILGVIGNGLSFCIFYPKTLKFNNQSSYCFLTILSGFDTLALILSAIRGFLSEAFGIDIVLIFHCGYYLFFSYLSTDMAIYTIVCMTIDRAISVFFPFKAKILCTRNRALISTSVVFLVLIGINIPMVFVIKPLEIGNILNTSTETVYACDAPSEFYNFLHFVWPWVDLTVLSFVPFLVLTVLNGAILIRMKRQIRRVHAAGQSLNSRLSAQRRTNILLMTICVAFFISTAPLSVFHIVEPYWKSKENDSHQKAIHFLLTVISLLLLFMNNCVNFFLYCLSSREFRKDLGQIFCKHESGESEDVTALS